MKVRLLALDMDGTTLTSNQTITEETVTWVKKASEYGVKVVFATGRDKNSVKNYIQPFNFGIPKVLLNGSLVINEEEEVIEQYFLDPDVILRLNPLIRQYGISYTGYNTEGIVRQEDDDLNGKDKWYKICLVSEDTTILKKLQTIISKWETIEVTCSYWNNIEINPKGISKSTGIQTICQTLGINMSEVMAIGDSLNDYQLFKDVGLSIAMDNAQPSLKEVATFSTLSNDQDGVAQAIKNYIF